MNYSPLRAEKYGVFGFVVETPEAWNLAFLSHDYEAGRSRADFGADVRHTLMFDLASGKVDYCGPPEGSTIIPWLRLPAPQFVAYMGRMPATLLSRMPLAQRYGVSAWLRLMHRRSYLFREPHDPVHDAPVTSTAEAQALLAKLR